MNHKLAQAIKHWGYVAPLIKYPKNDKEFDQLAKQLDHLLEIVGENENHRLMGLVDIVSNIISEYESEHHPLNRTNGVNALKFLMETNDLRQTDLPEIASQGVLSEILNGKRKLNLRQIKLLAKRFKVKPETFMDG